jgi:hypothetical protein
LRERPYGPANCRGLTNCGGECRQHIIRCRGDDYWDHHLDSDGFGCLRRNANGVKCDLEGYAQGHHSLATNSRTRCQSRISRSIGISSDGVARCEHCVDGVRQLPRFHSSIRKDRRTHLCGQLEDRRGWRPRSSSPAQNRKAGKKESTGRRLSQPCPPCARPSSKSSLDHCRGDVPTAENGFATRYSMNKSAKVVLVVSPRSRCDEHHSRAVVFYCAHMRTPPWARWRGSAHSAYTDLSVTVRRCGVSSAKSCGGNAARKRLDRPRSSCRGGVPYGIRRRSCVTTATRVHLVRRKCPRIYPIIE